MFCVWIKKDKSNYNIHNKMTKLVMWTYFKNMDAAGCHKSSRRRPKNVGVMQDHSIRPDSYSRCDPKYWDRISEVNDQDAALVACMCGTGESTDSHKIPTLYKKTCFEMKHIFYPGFCFVKNDMLILNTNGIQWDSQVECYHFTNNNCECFLRSEEHTGRTWTSVSVPSGL